MRLVDVLLALPQLMLALLVITVLGPAPSTPPSPSRSG
jgi:ABC-type dipeptide/oligopeptide/nickel transport system permease subunit